MNVRKEFPGGPPIARQEDMFPSTGESEYEEIPDHLQRKNGLNAKKSSEDEKEERLCSLCGNANGVVRCELCFSQIFCGSCNDMYHRHPKRRHHVRELLDSMENRPPLPPQAFIECKQRSFSSDLPPIPPQSHGFSSGIVPVAPPRRRRMFTTLRSSMNSPTFQKKTFDPLGSLKRFVGGITSRPLPPPPHPNGPPLPPKSDLRSRPSTPTFGPAGSSTDRRFSSPQPSSLGIIQVPNSSYVSRNIPLTVLEMQNRRPQSASVANLSVAQTATARPNPVSYHEWEDYRNTDSLARSRDTSMSTSMLHHQPISSQQNASHFATLRRNNSAKSSRKPSEPSPPPLPPRNHSSMSQSVFDLSQMPPSHQMPFGMPPWYFPPGYPMEFQQQMMMGYPGQLKKSPSSSSFTGSTPQFMGWPPFYPPHMMMSPEHHGMMGAFEPPNTGASSHLDSGNESEPPSNTYGNQHRPLPPPPLPPRPKTPQGPVVRRQTGSSSRRSEAPDESRMAAMKGRSSPHPHRSVRGSTAPPPEVHQESEEDSYLTADRIKLEKDESDESMMCIEMTSEPEGPWTCEHCTFINPKSTKICTVCCKTPTVGYRVMQVKGKGKGSSNPPPVVKSKLSISKGVGGTSAANNDEVARVVNVEEEVERGTLGGEVSYGSVSVRAPPVKRKDSKTSNLPPKVESSSEEFESLSNEEEKEEIPIVHHKIRLHTTGKGKPIQTRKKTPLRTATPCSSSGEESDTDGSIIQELIAATNSPRIEIKRRSGTKAIDKEVELRTAPVKSSNLKVEAKTLEADKNIQPKKSKEKDVSQKHKGQSSKSKPSVEQSKHGKKDEMKKNVPKKKQMSVSTQADSSVEDKENASDENIMSSSSESIRNNVGAATKEDIKHENKRKTSQGTSPPPQTISTQTYEELPLMPAKGKNSQKTGSKTSLYSFEEHYPGPQKSLEMSDKAQRYLRKAQNQHNPKLKRSQSTHLTSMIPVYSMSSGDNTPYWTDSNGSEGRHFYRSSSRHSLTSDTRSLPYSGATSRESSPPLMLRNGRLYDDIRRFGPPSVESGPHNGNSRYSSPADYLYSVEDMVNRKRRESMKTQEFELTHLLKEAEQYNYTPEDVQVALKMCADKNPLQWLQENWFSMIDTVKTLSTKYGLEKGSQRNDIGTVTVPEAKEALRIHKGNVWAAVTECVDQRKKKFDDISSRGNFSREEILSALTSTHGNVESAYVELSKAQLKPFLMRIWGSPTESGNDASSTTKPIQNPDTHEVQRDEEEEFDDEEEKLAKLVSNAEKVTLEIGKTIQELRVSKRRASVDTGSTNKVGQFVLPLAEKTSGRVAKKENAKGKPITVSSTEEGPRKESFTPPILTDSVQDTVNKKAAKYARVAAKKKQSSETSVDLASKSNKSKSPTKLNKHSPAPLAETDAGFNLPNGKLVRPTKSPVPLKCEKPSDAIKLMKTTAVNKNASVSCSSKKMKNAPQPVDTTPLQSKEFKLDEKFQFNKLDEEDTSYGLLDLSDQSAEEMEDAEELNSSEEISQEESPEQREQMKDEEEYPSDQSDASGSEEEEFSASESLSDSASQQELKGTSEEEELLGSENESEVSFEEEEIMETSKSEDEEINNEDNDKHEANASSKLENDKEKTDKVQVLEDNTNSEKNEQPTSSNVAISVHGNSLLRQPDISNVEGESVDTAAQEHVVDSLLKISNNANNEVVSGPEMKEKIEPTTEKAEADSSVSKKKSKKLSEKATAKKLMKNGLVDTIEKAELAAQLITMEFSQEDALQAAKECLSLEGAISFLQQECHLCAEKFNAKNMIAMLRCTHWCCKTCAIKYFEFQVKEKSILAVTCPFCKEPADLAENADAAAEYFNNLDILLKNLLEPRFHEMFHSKLRDWALIKMPNFKWCSKCSSGFITEPLQARLVCPDCSAVTCAVCLEPWDKFNHTHKESKMELCDKPENPTIVDYLNENCVECPRCRLRFALARGGCMHLTCSQCRYEFCSGCAAPFYMGEKCVSKYPFCAKLGLHAHHPRNCLFYLRDKDPASLCKLLEEKGIPYLKEELPVPEGKFAIAGPPKKCLVPILKETDTGFQDDMCGKYALKGFASICKPHYVEYLGLLIWQNHLDPISILSNDDLETIIRREVKNLPPYQYGRTEAETRKKLLKIIEEEVPL